MLKQGHLGVHPAGALGVAMFMHAHAECFIGRAGGGVTEDLRRAGSLRLDDGQAVRVIPLRGRIFSNLLEADAHSAAPELLVVCCNPGQLAAFTGELTQFVASHARRGHLRNVEDVRRHTPILLLLPNGILAEETVETYGRQLNEARLLDRLPGVSGEMIDELLARVVRGVSMQAGGRRGAGAETVYVLERCGQVLFAGGSRQARDRVVDILAAHQYPGRHVPDVPATRIEFDKAMISIVINVGGLIHLVKPDGELIDLRMGDLCLDPTHGEFVARITRAVFDVGKAIGAYGADDVYERIWEGHRSIILAHARHVTSSIKTFRDAVAGGTAGVALMTNEEWILTPLRRYAIRAGMEEEAELFRSLAQRVQESMARAIKRRPRGAAPRSSRYGDQAMKLIAQRTITMELFEAGPDDLAIAGTLLDSEHLITLELTIHLPDEQITASRLDMIRVPYHVCREVESAAESLIGLRIQRGVMNEISKRVGGRVGCSHLREIATAIVYYAATHMARRQIGLDLGGGESVHLPVEEKFRLSRALLNGTCLAYCQSSPLELDKHMGIRRIGPVHESPIPLGEYEPSLGVVLRERAKEHGDKILLRHRPRRFDAPRESAPVASLTYHDFASTIFLIARHLIACEVRAGDRIAMLSENRAEMFMFEVAAMAIGAVSVPVHAGYPSPQISYILRHSRPRLAVVSGMHQLEKIDAQRHPWVERWFCMDFGPGPEQWGAQDFALLLAPDGGALVEELEARVDAVRPDDLCMVMYTSGTTGPPKGVRLAHRNIISQQKAMTLIWDVSARDVLLSYLPWHHSFGGLFERFMALYQGCELCLDDSAGRDIDRMLENWRHFQPTLFFSVPRVHDLLLARCRQDREAENLVFGGRLRFVFTAGASLPAHVAQIYRDHRIPVLEGWGLTETSPACTITTIDREWRSGYVGLPIPGVSIRIDSDQEILVRGPNVMQGYLDDEEMTARVIDEDGWFHSGDLGEFQSGTGSSAGLRILGRRDGAFKLTTGEKVHPHRIENLLAGESAFINTAVVLGSGRDYVAALIFPDRQRLGEWARERGLVGEVDAAMLANPDVCELFASEVARINPMIDVKYHRPSRIVLVDRTLSLERGELTPSGKVCRDRICEGCRREIEMLFADPPPASVLTIEAHRAAPVLAGRGE